MRLRNEENEITSYFHSGSRKNFESCCFHNVADFGSRSSLEVWQSDIFTRPCEKIPDRSPRSKLILVTREISEIQWSSAFPVWPPKKYLENRDEWRVWLVFFNASCLLASSENGQTTHWQHCYSSSDLRSGSHLFSAFDFFEIRGTPTLTISGANFLTARILSAPKINWPFIWKCANSGT